MLKLPLWFATVCDSKVGNSLPPDMSETFAFSTIHKLMSFLDCGKAGKWNVYCVTDREGLTVLIADVHTLAHNSVYLDPDSDGHGGVCILLNDLMLIE